MTKDDLIFSNEVIIYDRKRLTNQLWKLIPMRENGENWQLQLESVYVELKGLNKIFVLSNNYLIALSKLLGLKDEDIDFPLYRKTIFEIITAIKELGD